MGHVNDAASATRAGTNRTVERPLTPPGALRPPRVHPTSTATRLPVLFITEHLPWPVDSGGRIRTFNLLKQVSEHHDVTLVAQAPPGPEGAAARAAVAPLVAALHVLEQPPKSLAHQAADAARALALRRPYLSAWRHHSAAMQARIAELCRTQRFALAHLDHLDSSVYRAALPPDLPTYLDAHNYETQLLGARRERATDAWRRAYFGHEQRLLESYERRAVLDASAVGVVSANDAVLFSRAVPERSVAEVPNGVDLEYFDITRRPVPGRLTSIGSLDWPPNVEGLVWFIERVWPQIASAEPSASLHMVGRNPPRTLARGGDKRVLLVGRVPDVRPHATECGVFVVPLLAGGGTRLKILEAFAMRLPVVSTTVGAEGIACRDGAEILLADTPEAFAARVLQVQRDPALAARLGAAGRALVEARYGWKAIGAHLDTLYRSIARA